jgi:two-component system sensor histidine kinase ChvG
MSRYLGPLQPLFDRPQPQGGLSVATQIIVINALAMMLMVAGLLYFGRYMERLVESEAGLLLRQGQIIAKKVGDDWGSDAAAQRQLLMAFSEETNMRTQLIGVQGSQLLDLRPTIPAPGSPTPRSDDITDKLTGLFIWLAMQVPYTQNLPIYQDSESERVDTAKALSGSRSWTLWTDAHENLILTAAVPIYQGAELLGAIQLTRTSGEIATTLRSIRVELLQVFGLMLGISMVLSLYMAQTIARPLRRLAKAAQRAQAIAGGPPDIPDLAHRGDEIGDLSVALRAMTRALWDRLDAIETFAADVSHEIKNPLTSMKSALETLSRVKDPAQQEKLISILSEDITRMQRLITDISGASRLEAELSRTTPELFDLAALLANLVTSRTKAGTPLQFHVSSSGLMVRGIPGRLIQVAENLIGNALSFSPPGKPVTLRLSAQNRVVTLKVEDSGPGIAAGKEEKIFERFYSERPEGESFGTHSGLGLSICKQIVEGHGGRIIAENRLDDAGKISGARFIVTLPQQLA